MKKLLLTSFQIRSQKIRLPGYTMNNNPAFNLPDKAIELYVRMLKEKDAEIESLKKMTGEMKRSYILSPKIQLKCKIYYPGLH